MTVTRPLLSLAFVLLAALPAAAQQLVPVAPRARDAAFVEAGVTSLVAAASQRDTFPSPRREISPVGTVIGGVLGATLGTFAGVLAGSAMSEGCHGEDCQLGSVILGGVIGESLGLALGAHVGSRSTDHSRIVATTLTSAGVIVGGVLVGVGLGRGGALMVPLTPAFQLAAALAIESQ